MRGNGSTDQGEGKMGKHRSRVPTREKFRRKKVPTGKSSDRKSSDGKVPTGKVPTGKVPIGKKFRPGKSSDGKKFRPGKSSDQGEREKCKVPSIGQGRYIAILIK